MDQKVLSILIFHLVLSLLLELQSVFVIRDAPSHRTGRHGRATVQDLTMTIRITWLTAEVVLKNVAASRSGFLEPLK